MSHDLFCPHLGNQKSAFQVETTMTHGKNYAIFNLNIHIKFILCSEATIIYTAIMKFQ